MNPTPWPLIALGALAIMLGVVNALAVIVQSAARVVRWLRQKRTK